MNEEQVAALRSAAEEGVAVDGLEASVTGDGYAFAVPRSSYTGLSADEFADVARRHAPHVTEWFYWTHVVPDTPDRWAFCRWLERAEAGEGPDRRERIQDGLERTWGQLSITVSPAEDGRRTYAVRHVDDRDAALDALTVHADPADAIHLRRFDDGDYRPLSTAPTLATGWAFVDLEPAELVETVEGFYPATIANWYRERRGELDVSHWRETAERQTGIYDLIDELEGDAVRAVAAACCVDSECLKRREWDEHGGEGGDLDVPRGEGEFPCREPCSLVVAAAREFTKTEREDSRTYEFELRPREKAQLERIVHAVADGDVEGVGAGAVTDAANRLRARYFRERRFDDGTLPAAEAARSDDSGSPSG